MDENQAPKYASDFLHLKQRNAALERPRDGQLVYADGTNWNPGDGIGVYVYDGSTYVLLSGAVALGTVGDSAYEAAVANGFVGTISEWLASLVGDQGVPGADGEGVIAGGAAGQVLAKASTTDYDTEWIDAGSGITKTGISISSTSTLTTGIKGSVQIPYACTINSVTLLADQIGSIVIDIWKDTFANHPPTVADTITASAKPTISTADKAQDTTLTGWTTTIVAGDILTFNVDSCTDITKCVLTLELES